MINSGSNLGTPKKMMMEDYGSNPCFPGEHQNSLHVFSLHSPQNISPGVVSKFGNQTLKVGLSSFHPIHNCHVRAPPPHSHTNRGYQILTGPKMCTNCPKCLPMSFFPRSVITSLADSFLASSRHLKRLKRSDAPSANNSYPIPCIIRGKRL